MMSAVSQLMAIKQGVRKKLGYYYRFVKTYFKNRYVFNRLIDLQHCSLSYYSTLQQCNVDESAVLKLVESGDVIVVKNLIGQLELQQQFDKLSNDFFAVDYQQLNNIHQLKSVKQIVDNALAVRHSVPTLILQSSIMKRLLAPHISAAYLELQPNLRLHLPYGKIKAHEQYVESRLGRGKLNPHGQHKDSWRYHPKNTINVWLALTEANDKNGLAILPQSADYQPKFDVKRQEIESGVKTYPSQQYVTNLAAGDGIMFQAELVHGSIINMTKQTRVALSMRCTPSEPQFHKRVTYNYIKVENGRFDNLSKSKLNASGAFEPTSRDNDFAPAQQRNSSIIPIKYDEQHITLQVDGITKQFPRKCPHAGTDLLNGELNEKGELLCPSHRMCIAGKPCE